MKANFIRQIINTFTKVKEKLLIHLWHFNASCLEILMLPVIIDVKQY